MNTRMSWTGCHRAVLCSLLAAVLLSGCGYPEVSPKTYAIAKAMYRVCNQRQSARLDEMTQLIDRSLSSGEISEDESRWLRDIIAEAKSGAWDDALAEVRNLMEDQIVD